jgi:platelet-activating factor acetylhydrolase IB subunit beta/gamma
MKLKQFGRAFRSVFLLAALTSWDAPNAAEVCSPFSTVTVTPEPRKEANRIARHDLLKSRFPNSADVVIVGDSIARRFSKAFYPPQFSGQRVLNLGVGGDRTQNVLWRLNDLPLSRVSPKTVVVILGTNNLREKDAPCDIYTGISAVVAKTKIAWPKADVIVTQILPRGKDFAFRRADRIALNEMLASGQSSNGYRLLLVDEDSFTAESNDGFPTSYKPDLLHLAAPGYVHLSVAMQAFLGK